MFKMIAACTRTKGIGMDGKVPWNLRPDLKRFKELTVGTGYNAILMGRKTWESLPPKIRPLEGRINVILSSQGGQLKVWGEKDGGQPTFVAPDKEAVLDLALSHSWDTVWIIGGESVYEEFMRSPSLSEIYLTEVDTGETCDRHFPSVPSHFALRHPGPWQSDSTTGLGYRYLRYVNQISDLNRYL